MHELLLLKERRRGGGGRGGRGEPVKATFPLRDEHLLVLIDEIIEGNDLILEAEAERIPVKEVRVLVKQLLPHEACECRVDVGLNLGGWGGESSGRGWRDRMKR